MSRPEHNRPPSEGTQGRASLILRPDFTIMDATEEYLSATLLDRNEAVDQNVFDVFPDNPDDPTASGTSNLRRSLERVLKSGRSDRMPLQRYDVQDRIAGHGWVEKFWLPRNQPVFGSGSREITHLIHEVTDVTVAVWLQGFIAERSRAVAEQALSLRRMQRDLRRAEVELRAAQRRVRDILRGAGDVEQMDQLRQELGAPESRRYSTPGMHATEDGIYDAYHHAQCNFQPHRIWIRKHWRFPDCPICRGRVRYRLGRSAPPPG
jgi:hypothetical protein